MSIVLGQEEVGWMLLVVVLWAVVVARLSHHYGADATQGTSNTAAKECRRQWRKITAQGGTFETQDHLKRKITTDGTSYTTDKVEKYRQPRGVTLLGRNVPNPIRISMTLGFQWVGCCWWWCYGRLSSLGYHIIMVLMGLSHHYGADAAQGTSNIAANEYRRQWRKITAQGGTSETQDHLKRKITTDGTSYTADKVEKYRQRRGVTLLGRNVPKSIRIFDDSGFPKKVIQEFSKPGFVRPTPIQAQVWPMAL
ncbi:hypothetical protein ACFX2I_028870 [Malus domestica]